MSTPAHTPGPWTLHHQPDDMMGPSDCDWSLQSEAAGAFLLFCHHPDAPAKANGHLIAAAPDLKALADAITIFSVEEFEDRLWLRFAGEHICEVAANSPQGVALLKLEAARQAAIAKAERMS